VRDDLEIPPPGYRVARRPARVDPATRRLATIAAGIGGALVVLVGIWSMIGGSSTGIPVVPPPAGPMRVAPANPGGMKVAGANDRILGGGGAASDTAALAPPPETPNLQALQNPAPPAASASAPAAVAAVGAAHATKDATPPPPVGATRNGLPLPPPAPPPVQFAAASTAPPPPAAIGTGTATQVQLAALNSEDAAMREWQGLQTEFPNLFDSRQPLVSKVDVDGHTFWRLRTGGFANVAEATSFCAAVRAKGKGCAIAAF
jgi:SPOR domain